MSCISFRVRTSLFERTTLSLALIDGGVFVCLAIPPPDDPKEDMVVPNDSPVPYTFKFSQVPALQKPGGTVKIVDSRTFTVSKTIAAAEVNIEPGAMR